METRLPRPTTAAMTLNLSAELQKVEIARKVLQTSQSLTNRQSAALSKAIELLNESKKGGRSDRSQCRDLLLDVYKRFDIDVLFLCSITLSITKLSEIKRNVSQFLCELSKWRSSVTIPQEVHDMATKVFSTVLSEIGASKLKERQVPEAEPIDSDGKGKRKFLIKKKSTPVKRKRTSMSEEPVEHFLGCREWRAQRPKPNTEGSIDVNNEPKTKGDGLVKEESQTPPASNTTVTDISTPEDVPLYATVLKLDTMDVIRALILQGEPEGRLTIPDMEGSTPFITIQCPITLALGFKANRERIKW